jgi:hypothetical protein
MDRRDVNRLDAYVSLQSCADLWHVIWTSIDVIIPNGRNDDTNNVRPRLSELKEVIRIVELAWSRWWNRRHAVAVEGHELHLALSHLAATLRQAQLDYAKGKMSDDLRLHQIALGDALKLHVALKDIRRLPPSLQGTTTLVRPPVPLRISTQGEEATCSPAPGKCTVNRRLERFCWV